MVHGPGTVSGHDWVTSRGHVTFDGWEIPWDVAWVCRRCSLQVGSLPENQRPSLGFRDAQDRSCDERMVAEVMES